MVEQSADRKFDSQSVLSWEDDLEELFPGMNIIHEVRVSGRSEWQILRELSDYMADTGGHLHRLTVLRYDAGRIDFTLKIAGIKMQQARNIIQILNSKGFVELAKIEHLMLK